MDERTTLVRAIDRYLKTLAPEVWYRKNWGGGIYSHKGDSDYTVCAWGRFCVIEAKHPVTQPELRPEQKFMQNKIRQAGGFAVEAHDLSDVIVAMEHVRRSVLEL